MFPIPEKLLEINAGRVCLITYVNDIFWISLSSLETYFGQFLIFRLESPSSIPITFQPFTRKLAVFLTYTSLFSRAIPTQPLNVRLLILHFGKQALLSVNKVPLLYWNLRTYSLILKHFYMHVCLCKSSFIRTLRLKFSKKVRTRQK